MVELVIRLVFSLAVVLGMLLLLTRLSAKRFRGGANALVRVVHRQPLSRTSAVAVVTVGSRVLVVGTTEHQVQLLTELDPEEIDLPSAVTVASPQVEEPAEVWELSTLDELFEPQADPRSDEVDEVDAVYAPRHAGTPCGPTPPVFASPARERSFANATAASRAADGALAGSILSAQTWKQAFAAATSRPRDAS
jgi:flagellar protein FliO/FliZ